MKNADYVYATSNLKSISGKMLTMDDFYRIIETGNFSRGLELLFDMGYFSKHVKDKSELNTALDNRLSETFKRISGYEIPELQMFLLENDFYNIKATIKCIYEGLDCEEYLIHPASQWSLSLYKNLIDENYKLIPDEFLDTVLHAKDLSATSKSGRETEEFIDNAFFEMGLKLSPNDFFRQWFTLLKKNGGVNKKSSQVLMKFLREHKNNAFSVEPIFGYWYGILTEIKNLKTALFGMYAKMDKEQIKERLCEVYVTSSSNR